MKTVLAYALLLLTLALTTVNAQTTYFLNVASDFGNNGDGSIRPGNSIGTSPITGYDVQICAPGGIGVQPGDLTAAPIQTNGFNQRGMTYDPVTGNLVFVDTRTGSGGAQVMTPNSAVYILDGTTGQIVGALNTNGIVNDTSGIGCIVTAAVADDGVVYVANQINSATAGNFKIYRWPTANVNAANFHEQATLAFSNKLEIAERLSQTIDVRGSGTNTQIIVGTSASNGPGTNCWIFTTADGTNFVQHRLYFPGITTPQFNDGITFGPGNTFFAKQVGKALWVLAWDPTTYAGSVINSYVPASPNDPLVNISSITWDKNTKLLGGLEEIGGTATGGPGKVWLFDFPDPLNRPPAILGSRIYPANFQKTTAPMGYVKFGGGKLYAHVSNNGFLVSLVQSVGLSAPTFNIDLPATNKVSASLTAHFEVQAVYDVTNYIWYSNNVVIAGANSYYIDIPNVQTSANGAKFKVVAYNAAGNATSAICTLKVVSASDFFHLTPLWSAVGGSTNYISANGGGGTPKERTIAYNALSNQLLVVRGVVNSTPSIFVLDATTGQYLYNMNVTGVSGGANLSLGGIGIADDGAVYACNAANNNTFRIYRWADTAPTTVPQVIFGTNSSAANANPVTDLTDATMFRFGDDLAVRGSGLNTEIALDSTSSTAKYAAVLHPTDSTMTNWVSTALLLQNIQGSYGSEAYGVSIGHSIQFGSTTGTFWEKRYNAAAGAPVAQMGYNSGGGISPLILANTGLPLFTNGVIGINFQLGLAAAVNFVGSIGANNVLPDQLALYDFSDPTQSVLLSQLNLVGSSGGGHAANNNAVAQVLFGTSATSSSNYLFVINGNNGINAYVLEGGAVPAPKVLIQPHTVRVLLTTSNSLSVTLDQPANITWYKGTNSPVNTGVTGNIYRIDGATANDEGDYFAIGVNANGSVTSQVAHVTVASADQFPTLNRVWAADAGNPSFPYITSNGGANTPNERAFAVNPVTGQIIIVRCPPASTAYALNVIDGATGTFQYALNTTGVVHEGGSEVSGSNPIDLVGAACADDGALYVCSETPNASGGNFGDPSKMMHIYRWANTQSSTAPTLVFEGDPSGQPPATNLRWGDVLCARGSGTTTELFMNSFEGNYGAILHPTDATMAVFTNGFFNDISGGGSIGRSVQFGPGNTVFEKRRGNALIQSSYNTNTQLATLVFNSPSSSTFGSVAVDLSRNLVAGVDFVGALNTRPDAVALYDIADPTAPLLLAEYPFTQNQIQNANSINQTLIVGNRVYAMDANNGFMVFDIVPPTPANPPALTISLSGQNVIVSWPQQGNFTLQGAGALLNANTSWTDIGTGTAANGQFVVTNSISVPAAFYRLRQ